MMESNTTSNNDSIYAQIEVCRNIISETNQLIERNNNKLIKLNKIKGEITGAINCLASVQSNAMDVRAQLSNAYSGIDTGKKSNELEGIAGEILSIQSAILSPKINKIDEEIDKINKLIKDKRKYIQELENEIQYLNSLL